jgi:nucleotide-binding universal stress UspA family protein
MTMHEILIPLSGGAADDPVLAAGAAMAGLYPGVTVTGAFAQPRPAEAVAWSPEGAFGGYSAEIVSALERSASEVLSACQTRLAAWPDIRLEHLSGHPDLILTDRAVLADLVVMDCNAARNVGRLAGVFERLLLVARTPMLVLRRPAETLTGRAVIAWDASPPAARALRAAIPVLAAMEEVLVVQAPDAIPESRAPFAGVEPVLSRLGAAGIKASHVTFTGGSNVCADLKALATDFGADLLVAGAYGHSRLGELVLGGTSRDLLRDKTSPNLLLHH